MNYISRDIEGKILAVSREYACLLITGPRQVGKTTVLRRLAEENREYVTLDDLEERRLAKTDPALFLQMHSLPILIDEVQYAPELFSYIKIAVDSGAAPGAFWLTGSRASGSPGPRRFSSWSWLKSLWRDESLSFGCRLSLSMRSMGRECVRRFLWSWRA